MYKIVDINVHGGVVHPVLEPESKILLFTLEDLAGDVQSCDKFITALNDNKDYLDYSGEVVNATLLGDKVVLSWLLDSQDMEPLNVDRVELSELVKEWRDKSS